MPLESSRNWRQTNDQPRQQTRSQEAELHARRLKFAIAVIGFVSSVTLLFTWRTADSQTATVLVSVIYLLTGLWLTVRFAPRE